MKIIENILNKFIEVPNNVDTLTNSHITEVENFDLGINSKNIVTGKIKEIWKHENADTLQVTLVDIGDGLEDKQIVCGASNIYEGQYVIVALDGAVLPGNFKIKKSKIRGVESNGMICSLDELGVAKASQSEEDFKGIYDFKNPVELGLNALEILELSGFIMELDLTPNRNDLLSHYGFAKDLASVLKTQTKLPLTNLVEDKKANPIKVEIESKNTNSYLARYIEGVDIKASPLWLKEALVKLGTAPVNNVVDITNYLLYTYGLPMHAFDASYFSNNLVVVKDNDHDLELETLDNTIINLTGEEVLITNGTEPVALGGIMGLKNSMVTDATKDIVLEVASFNRANNLATSNKLNLKSESQLRFSRGIDEALMEHVINHAAALITGVAGGKVLKGISSNVKKTNENPKIAITLANINKYLGTSLTNEELTEYLTNLNYTITEQKDTLEVIAPSYRNDVLMEFDVLEEVGRMIGLDSITNVPLKSTTVGKLSDRQKRIREIRTLLANNGLNEVITYSLLKEEDIKKFGNKGDIESVLKPISSDRTSLRQSLLNGGLGVINYNKNRNIANTFIFEIGNVFAKGIEDKHLSILLSGEVNTLHWNKTSTPIDFYYLSGILSKIMVELDIKYELKTSTHEGFHPYQQADIIVGKKVVGVIGKIHPKISRQNVYGLEINLEELPYKEAVIFEEISKFPNVERDIAVSLKDDIKVLELTKLIEQTARKVLIKQTVIDLYKGDNIEEGYQSIAIRMVFNDKEKTLESSEVDKIMKKITFRIEKELKGVIRT